MVVFVLLCCSPAIPKGLAKSLTFEQVLSAGLQHSFDRYIVQEEIGAAQAGVSEKEAENYPQLAVRFGNEYVHVFEEDSDIVSVGDAIIANSASGYKHSLIATAKYTLYDFGIRELNITHARRNVRIAELREQKARMETREALLELYTEGLKIQQRIKTLEEIYTARQNIFRMAERLHMAGSFRRDTLGDHALEMATAFSRLEDQRTAFQNLLERISFHTRQPYQADTTVLENFSRPEIPDSSADVMDFTRHPDMEIYDQKIVNKKAELSMAERARYPKLNLYGSWRQFGSDEQSYLDSLSTLEPRDTSLTLYVECPLFDGFANKAKRRKIHHEIAGLRYQREKKKAELEQDFSTALNTYRQSAALEKERHEQQIRITDQQHYGDRIAGQGLTDRITAQNRTIELTRQALELELKRIDNVSSALRLNLIKEAGS